jgi:hypothetical protein
LIPGVLPDGRDRFVCLQVMRDGEKKSDPLRPGDVFGEEILFQLGAGERGDLRMETHVAISSVELRCITRSDMLDLIERFPDLGQDLAKYVLERDNEKEPDTSIHDNKDWLVRCVTGASCTHALRGCLWFCSWNFSFSDHAVFYSLELFSYVCTGAAEEKSREDRGARHGRQPSGLQGRLPIEAALRADDWRGGCPPPFELLIPGVLRFENYVSLAERLFCRVSAT